MLAMKFRSESRCRNAPTTIEPRLSRACVRFDLGTEQRQRELGKDRTLEGINEIFTFEAVRDWVRRSAALIYTSGTLGSCACPLSWPGCIQSPAVGLAACKRQPKGSCACQLLPMALPMDMVQRRVRSWCWVLRYLP